jgi:hypothetical protein
MAAALLALLLLVACGTSKSAGGNGAIVHGIVRSVDSIEERVPFRHSISVDRGYGSYLTVEYILSTPVSFNGRSYAPADLEAGDEIDIRTSDLGSGRVRAQEITVTRTVNGIGTDASSESTGSTLSTIHGTIRSADRSNRTIELDSTNRSSKSKTNSGTVVIHYDPDVSVDYKGQVYPVTNLDRGDVVEMQVQSMGPSNYHAQRILLVRNVNGR